MSATNEDRPALDTESQQHRISLSGWATLSWLLALIYILSTGPAAKLYQFGVIPDGAMRIYAPVELVYQRLPPAKRLIDWYVQDVWHAK